MEKANEFLDDFYWDRYNNKFAVSTESSNNAHRALLPEHDLNKILSRKKKGTLSKNLEVQMREHNLSNLGRKAIVEASKG